MEAGTILRVRCVDGPCQGLQYLSLDTGRIVFNDSPEATHAIYRIYDHDAAIMTPDIDPPAHHVGARLSAVGRGTAAVPGTGRGVATPFPGTTSTA